MERARPLFDAIGGIETVREIRGLLDGMPTDGMVRVLLQPRRSNCGANRLAVFRRDRLVGGGYMAQWWLVNGGVGEVVHQIASRRPVDIKMAILVDVRSPDLEELAV